MMRSGLAFLISCVFITAHGALFTYPALWSGKSVSVFAAEKKPNHLPPFFTYLRAVDATILQEMRYYGPHNFVGRRVKGYQAAECILTRRAALALSKVQARLRTRGLSLKVYDCYRPVRAVKDFVAWSGNEDRKTKEEFYPTLKKRRLFGLGYIARRSSHSRGSTVDLTIVALPADDQPRYSPDEQVPCFEDVEKRFQDNSLDFGTGYDCFHELSHTLNPLIGETARRNRALLVSEMARAGFENYSKEWWHFTLINEPYKRRQFDFPIMPFQHGAIKEKGDEKKPEKNIERKTRESLEKDTLTAEIEKGVTDTGDEVPVHNGRAALLSVVCVASDDVLNVRALPRAGARLVGTLNPDAKGVKSAGCSGEISLADWHALSSLKRAKTPVPWCLVTHSHGAGKGAEDRIDGWVSGAFVIPDGGRARACRY